MSYILKRQKTKTAAALILMALAARAASQEESRRRVWCKSFILLYGRNGHYENVYNEWRYHDPEEFRVQLRMTPECFSNLLELVRPVIEKQDTFLRFAIPADKRLSCTLKHLATGKNNSLKKKCIYKFIISGASFSTLAGEFCMGKSTVGAIVVETAIAIATKLADFIKTPSTPEEWKVNFYRESYEFYYNLFISESCC